MTKTRVEINERETTKIIEKVNKINKALARWRKKRKTQTSKIRNERGHITIDPAK